MESFCLKPPAMNFLRKAGKQVIVECEGHIYSIPQQDFLRVSRLDPQTSKTYELHRESTVEHLENGERPATDTLSELSDSNLSHDHCVTPVATTNLTKPEASSSAAKVLAELKEEVTRLIDESIQKIELDWLQCTKKDKDAVREEIVASEARVAEPVRCTEDALKNLHPDGDRGILAHRGQNLQVLNTEPFIACKRQTRIKLLNEIRDLVERLKDMEKLEE
ncbi:uncharacterized protein LOC126562988 [Anopheles maculipalpis]|uniref:uncharacterized protein LOC126562988 n=1 Tax=Anopheles maculipalpis TaxID=1496333 RepID=UPI002158D59C|nr:uncharacterized protein LOC126562988 [Anopheles maculipalpis]